MTYKYDAAEDSTQKTCGGGGCSGFNYCFWAKFIVGVPTLFIASAIAANLFTTPLLQWVAAIMAPLLLVYGAIKIEQLPFLKGKIVKRK